MVYFKRAEFWHRTGADPRVRPDLDGNITSCPFKSESVDAIICKDVLEHVIDPLSAVREMHRVLKTGGLLYCSVPFLHPYHGSKVLPDYWRFTQDGLHVLFSDFGETRVLRAGEVAFVLRAFLPSSVNRVLYSTPLMPLVNALDRISLKRHATNSFMVLARK